jgi:hypothetical protein
MIAAMTQRTSGPVLELLLREPPGLEVLAQPGDRLAAFCV